MRTSVRPTLRIQSYESVESAESVLGASAHVFKGQQELIEGALYDRLVDKLGIGGSEFPTHESLCTRKALTDKD